MPTTDDSVKGADLMVSRIFDEGKNVKIKGTTAVFGMGKKSYIAVVFLLIIAVGLVFLPWDPGTLETISRILIVSFFILFALFLFLLTLALKVSLDYEKISSRIFWGFKTDIFWKDITSVRRFYPKSRASYIGHNNYSNLYSDNNYYVRIYRADGKFINISSRSPLYPYMEEFFRKYYPEAFQDTAQEQ